MTHTCSLFGSSRVSFKGVYYFGPCSASHPPNRFPLDGQDFHRFACVIPRSIGELLKIVEKDVVPIMVSLKRALSHLHHPPPSSCSINYHTLSEGFHPNEKEMHNGQYHLKHGSAATNMHMK